MRAPVPGSRRIPRSGGFTLLELLVAVAVFALLAALAYGGLARVSGQARVLAERARGIERTVMALAVLERDLAQALARPGRDALGGRRPALEAHADGRWILTRAGGALGEGPVRVGYGLEGGRLMRRVWPVPDPVQGTRALETALLDGVRALEVRWLDRDGKWLAAWPPPQSRAGRLPRAAELRLDLAGWGRIRRVVVMGGEG